MKQQSLIPDLHGEPLEASDPENIICNFRDVPGLRYLKTFLNVEHQRDLLMQIDNNPWLTDLSRRVQHYGYKYDYKARRVDHSMKIGALPPFGKEIAKKLVNQGLMQTEADQLIINEYQPGQGIAAHIDCEPCFGDEIVTVSLGAVYEMTLESQGQKVAIPLPLGSCLVFTGDARWKWTHAIVPRKSDPNPRGGKRIPRQRRVSLTFRNVKVE